MTLIRSKLTVDAVIFDLDGTLIDSIGVYYKIIDIVFQRLELPFVTSTQIAEAVKDGDFNWDAVLPEDMLNHKDKIVASARKIIDDIYPEMFGKDLKLIPGTAEVLQDIALSGMKIGIVTSTPAQGMAYKMKPLKSNGIEKLLEVIITADDVHEKKPAPEPLVECAKRLDSPLNKSVYVGDTRVDIRAGKAAGMMTVGVLTGFDDYTALKNEQPDAIINSINELRTAITI